MGQAVVTIAKWQPSDGPSARSRCDLRSSLLPGERPIKRLVGEHPVAGTPGAARALRTERIAAGHAPPLPHACLHRALAKRYAVEVSPFQPDT
jgi:hypothetical protein